MLRTVHTWILVISQMICERSRSSYPQNMTWGVILLTTRAWRTSAPCIVFRAVERFCGALGKISIWGPLWRHICKYVNQWCNYGADEGLYEICVRGPRPLFGAPTLWNAVSLHFEGSKHCSNPTAVRYVTVFNLRYVENIKLKHFRGPLSSRGPLASCRPLSAALVVFFTCADSPFFFSFF